LVDFKALVSNEQSQYLKQIERVEQQNGFTNSIEKTVEQAEKNLTDIENPKNSFVIYGEPQSGKTEMMI
jgi:DNA replication protein DnaC